MNAFEYSPRDACICGATLDAAVARVVRSYPPGEVSFLRCASCHSWCQSPRITAQTLAPWFESPAYIGSQNAPGAAYADYLADEPQRLREAEYRWRRTLRRVTPAGSKVLEIGCATGRFAPRDLDEVTGIDLSREFAEFARRTYALEILRADFLSCELGARRFHLILLLGTLCNLPRLHESLAKMRAHLAPGGALLFNFPDAGHWLARAYGRHFWMFTPSIDVFPTRRGCESLAQVGLRLLSVRPIANVEPASFSSPTRGWATPHVATRLGGQPAAAVRASGRRSASCVPRRQPVRAAYRGTAASSAVNRAAPHDWEPVPRGRLGCAMAGISAIDVPQFSAYASNGARFAASDSALVSVERRAARRQARSQHDGGGLHAEPI
jgi:SAM-dependent methyltransferase